MDERQMHKADFVTAVVLLAFSITVVVMSIQMPRLEQREINPYTIPGLVPGFLGVIIGILSVILLVRSIANAGYELAGSVRAIGPWLKGDSAWRIGLTLILSVIYAVGGIGRMPYVVATLIYVFVFVVLFEWRRGEPAGAQKRMLFFAALLAVLATAIIAGVFRYVFLVDLP